ncbi:hypothetical protein BJ508DRAFT_312555 [Ascobolus immersus RN42]|uniref:Uncharacterized protein n=1 Tax=Ascobolus immersus RN42 TaxID=1160509 RepID=A0A3N4HQK4_ASCIM|nr:hypothetical protein BJ508DRAFT_312555 [Ascobolus immersus RN42]
MPQFTIPVKYHIPEPNEVDLSVQRRLFCGTRVLSNKYLHISNAMLEKMFATPSDSNKPHHGQSYDKWLHAIEYKTSGGMTPEGLYRSPATGRNDYSPASRLDESPTSSPVMASTGVPKSREEIELETVRELLVINAFDINYMFAVAKNICLHRMSWEKTKLAEYCVREALGIDVDHPYWTLCVDLCSRNRDTWQNRTLKYAHNQAKLYLFNTVSGKQLLTDRKSKAWISYDANSDRNIFIAPSDGLINEGFMTLQKAKIIFHELIAGIDEKELENDDSPTAFGQLLMYKAISYIQLEITYILAFWTNFDTMGYTKYQGMRHCRDKTNLLSYIPSIDTQTNHWVTLRRRQSGSTPGSQATLNGSQGQGQTGADEVLREKVGLLFPMVVGKSYGATRRIMSVQPIKATSNAVLLPTTLFPADEESD